MQRPVWIIVALLVGGSLASQIPATDDASPSQQNVWRRTCDGWQRADWLPGAGPVHSPRPHPVVVALFLATLTLLAFVAFSADLPAGQGRDDARIASRGAGKASRDPPVD